MLYLSIGWYDKSILISNKFEFFFEYEISILNLPKLFLNLSNIFVKLWKSFCTDFKDDESDGNLKNIAIKEKLIAWKLMISLNYCTNKKGKKKKKFQILLADFQFLFIHPSYSQCFSKYFLFVTLSLFKTFFLFVILLLYKTFFTFIILFIISNFWKLCILIKLVTAIFGKNRNKQIDKDNRRSLQNKWNLNTTRATLNFFELINYNRK